MDLGLTYRALADGKVDVIAGNSTDGQIAALHLVSLEDDRGYFPPYEAAVVVRDETLRRHPALGAALEELRGKISDRDRKSTRLNSSHLVISYAVFCLKKKKNYQRPRIYLPANHRHQHYHAIA